MVTKLSATDHDQLAAEVVPDHPVTSHASYAHDKAKILARLRRIEGQVRGVGRMVGNAVARAKGRIEFSVSYA